MLHLNNCLKLLLIGVHSYHIPCRVSVFILPLRNGHGSNSVTVAKTRSQLNRRLPDGKKLPWPPFGKQWYAGCTTLIIGNSLKAGISTQAGSNTRSVGADLGRRIRRI
jgi:hypothetical protein